MNRARIAYLLIAFSLAGFLIYSNPDGMRNFIYAFNATERSIYVEAPDEHQSDSTLTPTMPVIISDSRIQHILYGDEKGGGHKHGVGKPCKSEFPQNWDDQKIIDVTRKIAANDNLPWERQRNGYHVAEAFEGDVKVRVVKGPQKQRVITAYPINVVRNPCPANDR